MQAKPCRVICQTQNQGIGCSAEKRMHEIASSRARFGFWRIYVPIRREGWRVNNKRIYRLYKEEGFNLRSKRPRRRRCAANRFYRLQLTRPNQVWSMDFVSDALFNGKKFRALTIVDNYTREYLAIVVAPSLTGDDVVHALLAIATEGRALPKRIQADNGPEFISLSLDKWAYDHAVVIDFSRRGEPTDNPFIESFNGSVCDECLNVHWFLSLEDASDKTESSRQDYNHFSHHSALSDTPPALLPVDYRIPLTARFSSFILSSWWEDIIVKNLAKE